MLTTDSNGQVKFEKLLANFKHDYIVVEKKTIEGYSLLKEPIAVGTMPVKVKNAPSSSYQGIWTYKDGSYFLFDVDYEVTNSSVFKTPTTGGTGLPYPLMILPFACFGLAGAVFIVIRKRNRMA